MRFTIIAWAAMLFSAADASSSVEDIIKRFTAADGTCGADAQLILAAIGDTYSCLKGNVQKPEPPKLD